MKLLFFISICLLFVSGCFLFPPPHIYGNNTVRITYAIDNVSQCIVDANWDLENMNCKEYVRDTCKFVFKNCTSTRPVTIRACKGD